MEEADRAGKSEIVTDLGMSAEPGWWNSNTSGHGGSLAFPFPSHSCPDISGNLWRGAFIYNFPVINALTSSHISSKAGNPGGYHPLVL